MNTPSYGLITLDPTSYEHLFVAHHLVHNEIYTHF